MTRTLLAFCVLCFTGLLSAQDYQTIKDLDRRSQKRFEEAKSFMRRQQIEQAISELTGILEKNPRAIDVRLLRGQLQSDMGELALAEQDMEAVLEMDETYRKVAVYQVGLVEARQEKYAEAVVHFQQYLSLVDEDDRYRGRVEKYLQKATVAAELLANPVPFDPVSIGATINTAGKEYLPSFSADGQLLVYTVNYDGQEDFYYSVLGEDGAWSEGQPLQGVNTLENEGAQNISADGRLLIFTGCDWPDSYGSCDLYYAQKKNGQWGNLRHAATPLNSKHWDTQPSLSANGEYLYFTSNRPGGFGGSDIWRSKRTANGGWGAPENLGETINTSGNEQSPFLHADGQTLYFASDAHPGLGDYDIFISRLGEGGEWQAPKNIGYPINTAAGEGALVVSLDGQTAYYTTGQNTEKGQPLNLDIYKFGLYEEARPAPVTYVAGIVRDAESKKPLSEATVEIRIDGQTAAFASLNTREDGSFLVVLPAGENYALETEQEGYLFYSDRFELSGDFTVDKPYELEIELQKIPEGEAAILEGKEPIVLRNVLFETGSAALLSVSEPELNRLYDLLVRYPDLKIKINGHTDNVGDDQSNLLLSENRAKAVQEYLLEKGIAAERLSAEGFGETRPIATNDTPEGRRLNRRTEFELRE